VQDQDVLKNPADKKWQNKSLTGLSCFIDYFLH